MYTLAATLMQKLFEVPESLKEELEQAIMSASIPPTCPSITASLNRRMVQKECKVFEASGRQLANLQTLYETLLTIQPTSVEAERAFSACGLFVTKLRSYLLNSTIDALCFTRNALQKQ